MMVTTVNMEVVIYFHIFYIHLLTYDESHRLCTDHQHCYFTIGQMKHV